MFQITSEAVIEIKNRLAQKEKAHYIRLRLGQGCGMGIKLAVEESAQSTDVKCRIDDIPFIIDPTLLHFFRNRTLDYSADPHGFRTFTME